MKVKIVLILLLVCLIGAIQAAPSTSTSTSTEVEAKIFVKETSEKLNQLYNNIAGKLYSSNEDEDDFTSFFASLVYIELISRELVKISKEARQYDTSTFKDPELKYALKQIIEAPQLFILEESYFTGFLFAVSALQKLAKDCDVEPYSNGYNDIEGQLALDPHINKIIAESQNPEELKYYWETWRDKNNIWSGVNLASLIEAFQQAANKTGISVLSMWLGYYDDPNFLNEMDTVMTQIKPFYMELHAFVRNELVKKYGDVIVNPKGPIPAHLFEQVLIQAWKNNSILESEFPSSKLPKYDKGLEDNDYDALKILKTADNFYKSLGLDPLDNDFWENRIKIDTDDQGTDSCKADIFDATPQVYMKYCKKADFKKFLQSHSWIGRIHYANQKKNLPYHFFDSYDLEYPIGEAVLLSASSLKHLQSKNIISNLKPDEDVLTNRLFRMSIHTMFNIPLFFVHSKIMNDVLINKVDIDDLNKHYWKLMEDYAGVEPPSDRISQTLDVPYKFYEDMESNYQTIKFVSEVLGYQFYHAMCEMSGQLKNTPLHNCDFYGNHAVGDSLKEMMKLGSSKPWRTVVSKIIPNKPGVDGNALLQYYEPIRAWLEKHNKKSGIKIGWEHTKRKIE